MMRAAYSITEVANRLHVTRQTISNRMRRGDLPFIRVSRVRRMVPAWAVDGDRLYVGAAEVSSNDVCAAFHVSHATLSRWWKSGTMPRLPNNRLPASVLMGLMRRPEPTTDL